MNDKLPPKEIINPHLPEWLKNLPEPEQRAYIRLFAVMRETSEQSNR